MTRLAALAVCIALPAAAQSTADISGTIVTLRPSDRPGAVAEVHMQNRMHNSSADEGEFTLTLDGLTITARFDWEVTIYGDDRVTVTPPDGVICVPADCTLTVQELFDGTLYLYSLESVGM
jgi:hypothetical protein